MQLYIRSQDKRKLIQMGSIVLEDVVKTNPNNPNNICINTTSTTNVVVANHIVGNYETVDRAKEVMNEIIGILEKSNRLMVSPNTKTSSKSKDGAILENNQTKVEKLSMDVVVYQMPEK